LNLARLFAVLWRSAVGLLLLGALGLGALVLADSTRDPDAIAAAVRQAFTERRLGDANGFDYANGRELSHFSECIGLSTAISKDSEPPLWFSLTSPALLWTAPIPMCRTLQDEVAGTPTSRYYAYSRYWHGYRLLTEPVLSRFSYATLQWLCAGLLAIATLGFALAAIRGTNSMQPLAAIGAVLLTTETAFLFMTPTHAVSFSVLLGAAALVLHLAGDADDRADRLFPPVFLLGAAYNFFDFLYNPDLMMFLAGWGYLVTRLGREPPATGRALAQAIALQMASVAGYVAMWVLKWMLVYAGGLIYGATPWLPADHVNRWLAGGEHGYLPFAATLALIRQSIATPQTALLMGASILGYAIALLLALRQGRAYAVLALGGLWLAPLAIVEVKAGHTIMHAPFTWRLLPWAAAMTAAAALAVLRRAEPIRRPSAAR